MEQAFLLNVEIEAQEKNFSLYFSDVSGTDEMVTIINTFIRKYTELMSRGTYRYPAKAVTTVMKRMDGQFIADEIEQELLLQSRPAVAKLAVYNHGGAIKCSCLSITEEMTAKQYFEDNPEGLAEFERILNQAYENHFDPYASEDSEMMEFELSKIGIGSINGELLDSQWGGNVLCYTLGPDIVANPIVLNTENPELDAFLDTSNIYSFASPEDMYLVCKVKGEN